MAFTTDKVVVLSAVQSTFAGARTMETMTRQEFDALLDGPMGQWYAGRWEYYGPVADMVKKLAPSSVLEIGPGKQTIVKHCDVMVKPEDDYWGKPERDIGKLYTFNATEKPWPVADKAYDLLIGLQVWEHLDNKQTRAFREVMRVSRQAILSFPFMWNCPKDDANYPEHHLIDKELIADWTLNVKPQRIVEVPRTGEEVSKGPRLIYLWSF